MDTLLVVATSTQKTLTWLQTSSYYFLRKKMKYRGWKKRFNVRHTPYL